MGVTYWEYLGDDEEFDRVVRVPSGFARPDNLDYWRETARDHWYEFLSEVSRTQ